MSRTFEASDSDPYLSSLLDSQCPVEAKLELRVGAQVILIKNLKVDEGLVNGARGVVTGFDSGQHGMIFCLLL